MTYEITDFMDIHVTVKPSLQLYTTKDFMGKAMPGIAIQLVQITGDGTEDYYGLLTVSFGEFIGMKNCAYIDANNCDFIDQLLKQGMATPTGLSKHSGFCEYPLWKFDEEKLKEMGEEAYKVYSDAYDQYMSSAHDPEEYEDVCKKIDSLEMSM